MKHIKWVNVLGALLVLVSLGCQLPLFASFSAPTVGDIVIAPEARVWPQKQFEENGKDNAVYFNGFKGIIFAKDISTDGQITNSADMFPKETSKVWVTFFYSRLKHGDAWGWKWTRDGVNILQEMDKKWEFEEGSGDVAFQVSANPELSGEYFLTLYYKGKEAASSGFYISKTKNFYLSEKDPADVEPAIFPTRALPARSTPAKPKPTTKPKPTINPEPTTNPNAPLQLPAEMSGSDETSKPSLILSNTYSDPDNLFTVASEGWKLQTGNGRNLSGWRQICLLPGANQ